MSSSTVSNAATQAEAARPGSGIYLAFIPWVVFALVAHHSTLKLAAVGALLASGLIAARSVRTGSVKVLELARCSRSSPSPPSRSKPTRRPLRSSTATRVHRRRGGAVHRAVRPRVGPAAALVLAAVQADQPPADNDVGGPCSPPWSRPT